MRLAGLCKGSTADSDSVCEGSNPSPAARWKTTPMGGFSFRMIYADGFIMSGKFNEFIENPVDEDVFYLLYWN